MSTYRLRIRKTIEVKADNESAAAEAANRILMECRGFADFDYDIEILEPEIPDDD